MYNDAEKTVCYHIVITAVHDEKSAPKYKLYLCHVFVQKGIH